MLDLWNIIQRFAPLGGDLYRDAHYLAARVPIDARTATRWLPAGLRLQSPARAIVFAAHFPHCSFGSVYNEVGILLEVRHFGVRAVHCPWMAVDDDVALILGRELLGYPKKLADIDWCHQGDSIRVRATRRGSALLDFDATLGAEVRNPPPMLGRPHRNVVGGLGLSPPRLVAFTPKETPVEVRRADIRLRVHGSERDPLAELGIGTPEDGHLHRVNLAASGVPLPVRLLSPTYLLRHFQLRHH